MDLKEHLTRTLGSAFTIEKELGGGGMSRVFVAEDTALRRKVVIKVLPPELSASVNVDRFRREVMIAAQLQHPHIVPVLSAGAADGGPLFYVMPFIAGASLRTRLARGELPIAEAVAVMRELADALAYAHRQGVVHRDIKPDNVLYGDGHAIVTDFGVSKALSASSGQETLTATGVALGTPAYMAPEQALADPNTDHRADIYSFGVVAYELLTGQTPFGPRSPQQLFAAHATENPPRPSLRRATIPAALEALIMRTLEKNPADRPQSAEEILGELDRILATSRVSGEVTTWRGKTTAATNWRAARVTVTMAALAAAVGAWFVVQSRSGVSPGGAPAEASRTRIAVLPFCAGGQLARWGEDFALLLAREVDGLGDLHALDPNTVLNAAARENAGCRDPDKLRAIATRLGASLYVMGNIVEAGTAVRADAMLYAVDGRPVMAMHDTLASGREMLQLVSRLARRMAGAVGAAERIDHVAATATASTEALRAFLDGERLLRAGAVVRAQGQYRRAVALDSTFALGWFRLSVASNWAGEQSAESRDAAAQAMRWAKRLADRERSLLDAWNAWMRGGIAETLERSRRYVSLYPDDPDGWDLLGNTELHNAPLFGRSGVEAREPFQRVLRLRPNSDHAVNHLAWIELRDGNSRLADSLRHAWQTTSGGGDLSPLLALQEAVHHGDSAAERRVMGLLRSADELNLALGYWAVLAGGGELKRAIAPARLMTSSTRPAPVRAQGYIQIAYLESARGRWRAALSALDSAALINPQLALVHRSLMTLLRPVQPERSQLESLRVALVAMQPETALTAANQWIDSETPLMAHVRLYLLGMVTQRMGDDATWRRHARTLDTMANPPHTPVLGRNLARALGAHDAALKNRAASSLEELEAMRAELLFPLMHVSPFANHLTERFLRGRVLRQLGRDVDAGGWYESIAHGLLGWGDLMVSAPAELALAEVLEATGRPTDAATHYAHFIERWREADPEFQDMVASARTRLTQIRGGASTRTNYESVWTD